MNANRVIILFNYENLTRFEIARIISARTLQLSMGAPPLIKHDSTSAQKTAMKEFEMGVLPITVKRMTGKRAE